MATTTRTRKKPTAAQIKRRTDAAEALRAQQTAAILELAEGEAWTRWVKAGQLLRSYSANNALLILAQYPQATAVAGFNVWEKIGNPVELNVGHKGIAIWGKPYRSTKWIASHEARPEQVILDRDGDKVKVYTGYASYPICKVFDVSQTVHKTVDLPTRTPSMSDADADRLITLIENHLTSTGWAITNRDDLPAHIGGVTVHEDRTIHLPKNAAPAARAHSLLHEAAHAVLHGDDTWATISAYGLDKGCRGDAEVQAETVAYIVGNLLGVDMSSYSTGYVAGWATAGADREDKDAIVAKIEKSMKAVHAGVNALMDALDGPAVKVAALAE